MFFNDRFSCNKLNNVETDWLKLIRGVPQSTVFGPILVKIDVNDVQFNIISNKIQFADDTTIFCSEKKIQDSLEIFEKVVKNLINYFDCISLDLIADKTEIIILGFVESNDISFTIDGQ